MPASSVEKSRLRARLNGDVTSMPDSYLDDDVFADVEDQYAGYSRRVVFTAALLRVTSDLMMRAVTAVDYDEGDASEKRSQIMKHLQAMSAQFQKELSTLIADEAPFALWGGFAPTPEYKDAPDA